MPVALAEVKLKFGTKAEYNSLSVVDPSTIYFITDTNQVFVGKEDFSTATREISEVPSGSMKGQEGKIYLCTKNNSLYGYSGGKWILLSTSNSDIKINLSAGEGLTSNPTTITANGVISHRVPTGATVITADTKSVTLDYGSSFTTNEVTTDKFGHVTGISKRTVKMPNKPDIGSVLTFKGTVQDVTQLPVRDNTVGDVYHITSNGSEYVYLDTGWEELGPIVSTSGSNFIEKIPNESGYVAAIDTSGNVTSAGYKPVSGVTAGTYGPTHDTVKIPSFTVDQYGRIIKAENSSMGVADENYVVDSMCYIIDRYME